VAHEPLVSSEYGSGSAIGRANLCSSVILFRRHGRRSREPHRGRPGIGPLGSGASHGLWYPPGRRRSAPCSWPAACRS
jgi:hypothetical protein